MPTQSVLDGLLETGVVAIVRLDSSGEPRARRRGDAGGVRHIEFTMTTPGALRTLEEVTARYGDDVVFGAGRCSTQRRPRGVLAGARFIVAPNLNPAVIGLCNRYGVVSMPGALTPPRSSRPGRRAPAWSRSFPRAPRRARVYLRRARPLPRCGWPRWAGGPGERQRLYPRRRCLRRGGLQPGVEPAGGRRTGRPSPSGRGGSSRACARAGREGYS